MRARCRPEAILALGALAVSLLLATPAAATRLAFEAFLPGQAIPSSYGNRVSLFFDGAYKYGSEGGTTPNVAIGYSGGPAYQGAGYGDLIAVAFATDASGVLEITLSADAGYRVELAGFQLGGALYNDHVVDAVDVLSGPRALYHQTNVLVRGGGLAVTARTHTDVSFATPLVGHSLTIRIDASNLGSGASQIGIDNVVFAQAPEPGAAVLVCLGAGALALVRRRH